MRINSKKYFDTYKNGIGHELPDLIEAFDFTDSRGDFNYLTKVSAVYSSNIEGNSVDLNSFMNYEMNRQKFKPGKEIDEIENLIKAYEFAQSNDLNEENLLNCHQLLSQTLLIKSKRGIYREEPVGVFGSTGLRYMAVEPEFVKQEMKVFFSDLEVLSSTMLSEMEVFYFASLIHLRFAHIHPFMDGNGRAARLLEKWFLAKKLGHHFWKIPSEELYKNNLSKYYSAINLGVNFYALNYDNSLPLLEMLPNSLRI